MPDSFWGVDLRPIKVAVLDAAHRIEALESEVESLSGRVAKLEVAHAPPE